MKFLKKIRVNWIIVCWGVQFTFGFNSVQCIAACGRGGAEALKVTAFSLYYVSILGGGEICTLSTQSHTLEKSRRMETAGELNTFATVQCTMNDVQCSAPVGGSHTGYCLLYVSILGRGRAALALTALHCKCDHKSMVQVWYKYHKIVIQVWY